MHSVLQIEKEAIRLRRCLRIAERPDLKVLCALRFFKLFTESSTAGMESYLREFLPTMAEASRKVHAGDFLPEERESLLEFVELVTEHESELTNPEDLRAVTELAVNKKSAAEPATTAGASSARRVQVNSLFVEYYPDLDLPPRGRLLKLRVTASSISQKIDTDDIVVRNPVAEPDDRFLKQARDSVAAARRILASRFGLSEKRRYRFDFEVGSDGARLTGDSLGLAFAVGAIAAVDRIEMFRHRPTVSPRAVFSGALTPAGKVIPVDEEALKLKIDRAFNSDVELLVIPREHITSAWSHLQTLEEKSPSRKLELVGAGHLENVVADPRLLPMTKSSIAGFAVQSAWKARRTAAVQIPVLIILVAILVALVLPARFLPWFDDNPASSRVDPKNGTLRAYNTAGQLIWEHVNNYDLRDTMCNIVFDLDGDRRNEVLFAPQIRSNDSDRGYFFAYSTEGDSLFAGYCGLPGIYPDDDQPDYPYETHSITTLKVDDRVLICSILARENPTLAHIRLWNSAGDLLGWYINQGHLARPRSIDINVDGKEELLLMGFCNPENRACLLVLNAYSCSGVGPPYLSSKYDLSGVPRGNQIAYIVFPLTVIGWLDTPTMFNSPASQGIKLHKNGGIEINIMESADTLTHREIDMRYFLNDSLRVVGASCSSEYEKRVQVLIKEGKIPATNSFREILEQIEQAALDSVRYWDGTRFVSEAQLRAREPRK